MINETFFPKIIHFGKVTFIDAQSLIILGMALKKVTNTISFIAIEHMTSEILREQISELVLIQIWFVFA